jgi:multidrug efflux pump subunit AcrA (membrane-fusion protein)
MKVYDGSAWLAAYASLSGALIATNNLSDLENATNARTNLGLGTAATTASTDYATAAQGALADSALQSVSESDVTQHETALTITESQISDLGTYETADADILKADTADTITAPMAGQITDNVASLSFDMSASNNFETTPSATGALTFTGFTKGQSGNIYLDNSAGVTITAASTTYINATDLTTISSAGKYFLSYYCVDATGSAEIVLVSITQVLTGAGA